MAEIARAASDALKVRIRGLAQIAGRLDDGQGGFRQSVAIDLRSGIIPKGRGFDITIDILAKEVGRAGSKAYSREYDRLVGIFDQFVVEGGD